jgi:bifunctional non-homologous end joining protein LigD
MRIAEVDRGSEIEPSDARFTEAPIVDGRSDFNTLHSGKQKGEVQLCAFDLLAMGGEDLRALPLSMRKTNLERLLRGRPDGIFVNPLR